MRRVHLLDRELPDGRRVTLCNRWEGVGAERLDMTIDTTDMTCLACERRLNAEADDGDAARAWQVTYGRALNELRDRHREEFDLIRLDMLPDATTEARERRLSYEIYVAAHPR